MYKSKKPYLYGTGRRKSSVARVRLFPNGTGAITINGRDIDDYFGLETLKLIVRQPLATTETLGKVDIEATVVGGGVTGQAGACLLYTSIRTDVRVIAATNRDLKRMVAEHKFREDLYYRLNVMPLFLPPLRERREDILPLARLFLSRNNRKYDLERVLTPEMERGLLEYPWPGNIRELRNVIRCV